MRMKGFGLLATLALLGMCSAAQGQTSGYSGYLDVYIAKVKPEKRAELDAVGKRIAEANRRHKGDTWVAEELLYGDWDTLLFVSTRDSYAAVEKGYGAFMEALAKAGGPAGAGKLMQEMENCLVSSRAELRRRRGDLSVNAPADPAALSKLVGQARWIRTVTVHVRPGRVAEYEGLLREVKAASERANPQLATLVSQSAAGQHGTTFYLTALESSMAGFDSRPPLPSLLGEDLYQKFLTVSRETTQGVEITIAHFLPELSNPPEEIASAAPDFWRPKPRPAVTKAKPKTEATPKPQ